MNKYSNLLFNIMISACFAVVSSFIFAQEGEEQKVITEEIDDTTLKTLKVIENKSTKDMPFKKLETDIVLFMRGYGEATLKWTLGFEIFKDHTALIMQSPVFVQEANLALLLLMQRNWYFGINYRDKTVNSELYAGYIDIESNVKKHIRVGNKGINFSPLYPFIRGGRSSHLSPGASSQFEGERWRADAILRYDSEKKHKRVFYGKNERIENRNSISEWQKAKFFYIPLSNLFAKNAIIFVKDDKDSQWRRLLERDYSIDWHRHMLILKKSFPHGVVINLFEEKLVEDAIQGAKAYFSSSSIEEKIEDDFYTDINGIPFLVLKKYNSFSPFEIASIYELGSYNEGMEAYIVELNTENKKEEFKVELESDVFEDAKGAMCAKVLPLNAVMDYKDIAARYPFRESYTQIYDIFNQEDAEYGIELLSHFYTPVSDYVLPKEANGESIEVYKNGLPLLDFKYDEQKHIVHFSAEVTMADRIEIFYSENLQYSSQGNVKIGLGSQYKIFEWMNVFFATMSNIEISKEKKEIHDKYNFSTGATFKWKDFEAGSHFGFELDSNRHGKNAYISKNHFYSKYNSEKTYSIFTKPKIEVDLDVIKAENVSIHSNLYSKVNLWKIELEGKMSLQDTKHNENIVESAGHGVKMPFWFFYMDESFFINQDKESLSRSNVIKLKRYINLEHSGFVKYEDKTIQQGITSRLSSIIPPSNFGNFFLQLKLNMRQKYRQNPAVIEKKYSCLWVQSLQDLYSSGVAKPITRREELNFVFNWSRPTQMDYSSGFSFQGFNFNATLKADNNLRMLKQDVGEISLRLPLSYNEVFITPFLERYVAKKFRNKESFSYKSDFESMFQSLKDEYWFFSVPLFYDLFDPTLPAKLRMRDVDILYTFSNLYGLDISRLLSESYRDLYVPVEFEVSTSRILKSDTPFAKDLYKLQFAIKYAAQDIFRYKYGKGILKDIEGDELYRNYDFYFLFSKQKNLSFGFKSLHKIYFYKREDVKSGFENKFEIEAERVESTFKEKNWSETFSFLYSYSGAKSLINMLFSKFSNFSIFDVREERFSFVVGKKNYSTILNYKIECSHTQKTKIGEYGEMSVFASFSFGKTNRYSILCNFTIGLSGKVEY